MPTTNFILDYAIAGILSRDITFNVDMEYIDKALGGYLVKSVAGAVNKTLTVTEYRNRSFEFTGAITANIAVIVPNTRHLFTVLNNTTGAFTLTVRTLAGTGIVATAGTRIILVGNGTDIFQVSLAGFSAAAGANSDITSLSGLTTPLSAPQGGTGQSSYAIGDLLYASASNALSKLADVATGRLVSSGGVGAPPSYSASPSVRSIQFKGSSSGIVTVQVNTAAGTWTFTIPTSAGGNGGALQSDGSGVTAFTLSKNAVALTDAATVTPNVGTDGRPYLGILATLSQATNFANPTGTPTDGQLVRIRVTSTSSQFITWGTKYISSARLPLSFRTSGSGRRDHWTFQYCAVADKFDLVAGIYDLG